MKFLKMGCLLAMAALVLVGCGKKKDEGTAGAPRAPKKVLVMATNAEFPPYESIGAGGKIVGIDPDMMEAVCAKIGYQLKIENMAFDSIIPAIKSGKADIGVAGMTVTEDRKKNVDFSDSYITAAQVIIVKAGSTIAGKDDLKGKRIGVQSGTTGDELVAELLKPEGKEPQRFTKGSEAVLALLQDKLEAVVIDDQPAKRFVATNGKALVVLPAPLSSEEYAIAIDKGRDEILAQINQALAALKADGTLDAIKAKYITAE